MSFMGINMFRNEYELDCGHTITFEKDGLWYYRSITKQKSICMDCMTKEAIAAGIDVNKLTYGDLGISLGYSLRRFGDEIVHKPVIGDEYVTLRIKIPSTCGECPFYSEEPLKDTMLINCSQGFMGNEGLRYYSHIITKYEGCRLGEKS
jgi:hypothetical protein